ncbi:hypothetical protein [Azospirillum doebereinerae]
MSRAAKRGPRRTGVCAAPHKNGPRALKSVGSEAIMMKR